VKIRIAICALALLTACTHKPPVGPKIDPALATLVPADTTMLVGTRLEALARTPVYQKYFANRKFPQVEEFAKQTGIDPTKDLWELLFVSNGKDSVLLGRGRFANEMEPQLPATHGKRFNYKGYNFVGDENAALLYLSGSTAALGPTASLRNLLDQRGKSDGAPANMAALMKDIPSDAQFWAVYAGGAIDLKLPGNLGNVGKMMSSVESGSLYFDLRAGLNGVAQGQSTTDQGAEELQGALKAFIGLGRLNTPANQKELQSAWDGLRVTNQDRRVKLYIDVPQSVVDQFVNLWMGRGR
jgi:hypothetical protein